MHISLSSLANQWGETSPRGLSSRDAGKTTTNKDLNSQGAILALERGDINTTIFFVGLLYLELLGGNVSGRIRTPTAPPKELLQTMRGNRLDSSAGRRGSRGGVNLAPPQRPRRLANFWWRNPSRPD